MRQRLATLLLVISTGCTSPEPPLLPELGQQTEKPVVVLVPGITGTKLRNRETEHVVWVTWNSMYMPRDGGYDMARSIFNASPDTDRLDAFAPVFHVDIFGIFRWHIYGPIVGMFEENGYRQGDMGAPAPDEDLFVVPYDWRYGSADAAAELARNLERVRAVRGGDPLNVVLVCQSNAALICRYFAKFGGGTLDEAESGRAAPPEGIRVEKLILVGTANGGAIRGLREINRGRRYIALVGRWMRPEVIFSFPSVYEGLPVRRDDLFFDERGDLLDIDLFDAASWERYGWAVFEPETRERLRRAGRTDLFGTVPEQRHALQGMLDEARRLNGLLRRDAPGFGHPRYYSVQNASRPTPIRALLVPDEATWGTYFLGDDRVDRDPHLRELASGPGDGHAERGSQLWLSPQEDAALARPSAQVEGNHFSLIQSPGAMRALLEFLAD